MPTVHHRDEHPVLHPDLPWHQSWRTGTIIKEGWRGKTQAEIPWGPTEALVTAPSPVSCLYACGALLPTPLQTVNAPERGGHQTWQKMKPKQSGEAPKADPGLEAALYTAS